MAKRRLKSKSAPSAAHSPRSGRAVSPRPSPSPQQRTTYIEAVAIYERGLEAIQRHDYHSALDLLNSVLRLYPEEKELHERVKLYLNVCQRQAEPRETVPRSVDERLYA